MSEATLPTQSVASLEEQLDNATRALEQGDFMLARTIVSALPVRVSQNDQQKVDRFMHNLRVDPVALVTALTVAIGLALVASVTLFH
jgi:hypothetical protein